MPFQKLYVHIVFSCFLMLLSGCTSLQYTFDADEYNKANMAVVITRAEYMSHDVLSTWKVLNNNFSCTKQLTYKFGETAAFFRGGSTKYRAYMIDPGLYYLFSLSFRSYDFNFMGESVSHSHHFHRIEDRKKISEGYESFVASPGDVIYIGDFHLEKKDHQWHIQVIDEFINAQKFVNDHYPSLSSKLQKQLIIFKYSTNNL